MCGFESRPAHQTVKRGLETSPFFYGFSLLNSVQASKDWRNESGGIRAFPGVVSARFPPRFPPERRGAGMYIRAVGKRYKVECRVTDPSGSVFSSKCGFATLFDPHGGRPASAGLGALSWNATFATKAEAQAHGTAKDKEFKAMVAGGFMPCSVRELLDRWRRELAPQRDGGKWDFNRLLAIEQRLDDMGLADLQLSAFKPRQMAAVRRARLGDRISPAGHARASQCG